MRDACWNAASRKKCPVLKACDSCDSYFSRLQCFTEWWGVTHNLIGNDRHSVTARHKQCQHLSLGPSQMPHLRQRRNKLEGNRYAALGRTATAPDC
jgi:hypothetical protein